VRLPISPVTVKLWESTGRAGGLSIYYYCSLPESCRLSPHLIASKSDLSQDNIVSLMDSILKHHLEQPQGEPQSATFKESGLHQVLKMLFCR
jgi:hypothetical protein